jgi:quinolinate synthase
MQNLLEKSLGNAGERMRLLQEIRQLAKEKEAIILAHNYQCAEVQEAADVVGDSLGLSLEAKKTNARLIVFCGVHFMAETAKILNPERKVLLPNPAAGCALANSITPESLDEWMNRYPDYTVVTYINSSAEIKAMSDICCTSANAVSVVRSLPSKKILFTPDRNLGAWVKKQVPEKEIVLYDGDCPTHDILYGAELRKVKEAHPEAVVIAHPECREDVLALADEVCSTTAMLSRVEKHPEAKTFIIATESGMLHQLRKRFPEKEFILADGCIGCRLHCPYMKATTLEDLHRALKEEVYEIKIPQKILEDARLALERMLAVPRDN